MAAIVAWMQETGVWVMLAAGLCLLIGGIGACFALWLEERRGSPSGGIRSAPRPPDPPPVPPPAIRPGNGGRPQPRVHQSGNPVPLRQPERPRAMPRVMSSEPRTIHDYPRCPVCRAGNDLGEQQVFRQADSPSGYHCINGHHWRMPQ